MWPAGATVGRQPSRCVFEMNPWREFYGCRYPPSFASTKMGYLRRRTCRAVRVGRPIGARCRRPHRVGRALAQLGFGERCEPNSQTAAAVAHIVLEAIEDRLPCLGLLGRRRTDLRPKVSRAGSEAATAGGASPEFTLRHRLDNVCARL